MASPWPATAACVDQGALAQFESLKAVVRSIR
jgi:hypothetical protein